MKTNLIIIGIFIITCFYLKSCDKDESNPTDFRTKYVGKYQVHEQIFSYGLGDPINSERDTYISVRYGGTNSTLLVLGREVLLDLSGCFTDYHYYLRLWNDSIYSSFMNGGLGGGQYEIYEGYKISDTP
jgi:hypothetical protein